jgi:GDPmannose 4,6-dehydratase
VLRAVITGVAGQDGSYLSELLLSKGYEVYGVNIRKSVNPGVDNISHLLSEDNFKYCEGDLSDPIFISRLLSDVRPHEFYNLGAASHVGYSFSNPVKVFQVNAESVIMHLSLIKDYSRATRYYQASTSEMLGGLDCPADGYDELSAMRPRSPYAISKCAAHMAVNNYKDAYGLHASSGILFNHSSPRRGMDFASRKITHGIASIKAGLKSTIKMGNLSAFRDEGHSKDYVRAMWMMLQQDRPDNYVIATGDGATIEQMFRYVCSLADLNFEDIYEMDERFLRPSDVPFLLGSAKKARAAFGWAPEYNWNSLLKEMYQNDLEKLNAPRTTCDGP